MQALKFFSNLYKKKNVDSSPICTRFDVNESKPGACTTQQSRGAGTLLSFKGVKRVRELSKPLSQCEVNDLNEAASEAQESTTRGVLKQGVGLEETAFEEVQSLHSKTLLRQPREECLCCKEDICQISIQQPATYMVKERTCAGSVRSAKSFEFAISSTKSVEAPLPSQLADQIDIDELHCQEILDELHEQNLHNSSEEKRQRLDTPEAEANMDRVVVFFSAEEVAQERASRVDRQKLSDICSLCSAYTQKVLRWASRLCRENNYVTCCMPCVGKKLRLARAGFVSFDCQAECSTNLSSPSLTKELEDDHELRAVLSKIDDVLASMARPCSDNALDCNNVHSVKA